MNTSLAIGRRSVELLCKSSLACFALLIAGVAPAQPRPPQRLVDAPAPRLVVQSGPRHPLGLAIALSPDKQLMATAGGERSGAYLWQVETGRQLCSVKADMDRDGAFIMQGRPPMTFSADGAQLATANDREILIWDTRGCRLQRSLPFVDEGGPVLTGMLTLPDGQVLAADEEGVLHKGSLFAPTGKLRALPKAPHQSTLLYGLSRDGRLVLTGGSSLRVVDVQTGAVEALAAYRAQPEASGSHAGPSLSAALSPSGRWVAQLDSGFVTLYDRQARTVVARARLDGQAAGVASGKPAATSPKGPPPLSMPPEMADLLKSMPPGAMRTELEQQMKSMLAKTSRAMQAAEGSDALPGWLGFSAQEDLVLLWKNPETTASNRAPRRPDPRPAIEIRRVPSLALVATVPIQDPSAVNREAAGAATSYAASRDGTALAMSLITGDMAGGRMGLVDLTRLPTEAVVRGWKPTGGGPGRIEWTPDGQLVAVHGGALGGGDTASLAGRVVSASRPAAGAPNLQTVLVQWSIDSGEVATRPVATGEMLPFALSPGGRFAAMIKAERRGDSLDPVAYRLELVDTQTRQTLQDNRLPGIAPSNLPTIGSMALSPDGLRVAILLEAPDSAPSKGKADPPRQRLSVYDSATGRLVAQQTLPGSADEHGPMPPKMRFLADGRGLVMVSGGLLRIRLTERGALAIENVETDGELHDVAGDGPLRLLQAGGGTARLPAGMQAIGLPEGEWAAVALNAAGTRLAAATEDGVVQLFDVARGGGVKASARVEGHAAKVVSLAFSPDGRRMASSDEQGTTIVRDAATGALLARLFAFTDGSWAVVDPQGRFDTNRLEDLEYLHWVMPDDPLRALPLDIFMREYFTPGLLGRVMRGDALPEVRPVDALNRAQPVVRIAAITPSRTDPRRVDVTVEAEGRADAAGRAGGVVDLRLFRDGRLVGYPERLGEALTLDPQTRRASRTFRDIRLPQAAESVVFSAYAFNGDRVKGATARSDYRLPPGPRPAQKGKAYLITIGVNRHDNPAFDLRFAAQDARLVADALAARLAAAKGYREVVAVQLVSDGERTRDASKARIRAVLAVLAGRPADLNELAGIANVAQLAAATPDDLVIITFAGHGHADDRGVYYLLPQDIGPGTARRATPQLLARSISSDELEAWLRDVDAGELALVIDACHAAASVEGEGFKPGPMGSRGLGQLAYDKGMRILAASQADDVAREPAGLRHGLLTFVLMRDGLEAGRADFKPADKRILLAEWLAFGVQGVPQLQRDLARGDRAPDGGARPADRPGVPLARVQQPRLFDFARQGEGPLIEVLR